MLAIEAVFTFVFGAATNLNTNSYGLGKMCLWDRDLLEYGGLCTHSPLIEAIRRDRRLPSGEIVTVEELTEEEAAMIEEQKRESIREWCRNYYHAARERSPERMKALAKRKNKQHYDNNLEKMKNRDAARHQKAKDEQLYHCAPCGQSLQNAQKLREHNETKTHKDIVAGRPVVRNTPELAAKKASSDRIRASEKYFCAICPRALESPTALQRHRDGPMHIRKVEAYKTALQNGTTDPAIDKIRAAEDVKVYDQAQAKKAATAAKAQA